MTNKLKQTILLPLILVLLAGTVFAQDEDLNDFATWSSIGLEYELGKKWSFGIEEQMRLKNNSSEIDKYFTELYAKYEAFGNFEFGSGFRYIRENDTKGAVQGYENHFRFDFDAAYKHKIKDFSFKYRFRYQNKNELGVSISDGDTPKQYIRFKTSIGYNIKNWKLDPKISAEIANRVFEGEDNGLKGLRLAIGTNYKIKKFGKIGLFYYFEKEINVDSPETTNVLRFKYVYTFKNK